MCVMCVMGNGYFKKVHLQGPLFCQPYKVQQYDDTKRAWKREQTDSAFLTLPMTFVIVTKIGKEISVALVNRTVINSLHIYALFVKKIVKIVLLVTGIITLALVCKEIITIVLLLKRIVALVVFVDKKSFFVAVYGLNNFC